MTAPDLIPAELLAKGAAYIEEHGLWQGELWPGGNSKEGGVWRPGRLAESMSEAVMAGLPACAIGALTIAAGAPGSDLVYRTASALARTLQGRRGVAEWNDTPGRTAAEVADAMRSCATSLRDGGQS